MIVGYAVGYRVSWHSAVGKTADRVFFDNEKAWSGDHCLHPDLVPINDDFPELIQSKPRKARIEKLFAKDDRSLSIESVKTALRDHENYPKSICRHANEHPTNGFWTSVSKLIS